MDEWYYDICKLTIQDVRYLDTLNESGDLGWELIAVKKHRNKPQRRPVVFKKPLPKVISEAPRYSSVAFTIATNSRIIAVVN